MSNPSVFMLCARDACIYLYRDREREKKNTEKEKERCILIWMQMEKDFYTGQKQMIPSAGVAVCCAISPFSMGTPSN